MVTLRKSSDKDFVILNFSDFQLTKEQWTAEHKQGMVIIDTINTLIKRVKPDLITLSGDNAWCGDHDALEAMAEFLEQFNTPWALVWGNHDQERGVEMLDKAEELLSKYKHLVYESGPRELGRGNYVIAIEEEGKIIEAIIMMDTHSMVPHKDKNGEEKMAWAKVTPEQIAWYKDRVEELKALNCKESMLITHIPIYAYNYAFESAFKKELDPKDITIEQSYQSEIWNKGYEDSFGVKYEGISGYPEDEGFFDVIKALDNTKNIMCGHDHTNNFSIVYEGTRFTFVMKTGSGCYWDPRLNGGTVTKINKNGVYDVHHEYVDVSKYL